MPTATWMLAMSMYVHSVVLLEPNFRSQLALIDRASYRACRKVRPSRVINGYKSAVLRVIWADSVWCGPGPALAMAQ